MNNDIRQRGFYWAEVISEEDIGRFTKVVLFRSLLGTVKDFMNDKILERLTHADVRNLNAVSSDYFEGLVKITINDDFYTDKRCFVFHYDNVCRLV